MEEVGTETGIEEEIEIEIETGMEAEASETLEMVGTRIEIGKG